jgi:hypothetical protein
MSIVEPTLKQSAVVVLLHCDSGFDEQSETLVPTIYLYQKARLQLRTDEYKIYLIDNTCFLGATTLL